MSYEFHIERREGGIPLEEWKAAVVQVENVKISAVAPSITNPKTGEIIKLGLKEGAANVYSPKDKKWSAMFNWSNGKISFKPAGLPGNNSDYVWQVAKRLASRLDAIIRGDQGETYDLKTGKAVAVKDVQNEQQVTPIEECKFIFRYNTSIELAAKGMQEILGRNGMLQTAFKFYGKSININRLIRDIKRVPYNNLELIGRDYSFSFGSVAQCHLDFFEIKSMPESKIPWDDWAMPFISSENFVMAWAMNSEYNHWQNAYDPLQYTALGKSYAHLPMKSNGLPYPLEKQIIDTSRNPGRWIFRDGYIEAVGATMWLGEPFWQLAGMDKSSVVKADWLRVSNPIPSVTKVQAADKCFATADEESGQIQKRLRTLLFGIPF